MSATEDQQIVNEYTEAVRCKIVNSPEYWDAIYKYELGKGLGRNDSKRYGMLVNYLQKSKNVLDFGCGWGEFIRLVKQYLPQTTFTGIDISGWAINHAKTIMPEFDWICGSEVVGGPYDAIIMSHVLEHYKDPTVYVKQAYNHLQDDGLYIVVLPVYDQVWSEHPRVWTLNLVRVFFKQFKEWDWIMYYRPDTGNKFGDGSPFEEVVVVLKKVKENVDTKGKTTSSKND